MRWLRRGLVLLAVLLAIAATSAAGVFFYWIYQAPRDVSHLTPYIEQALSSPDGRTRAHIGQTWVAWGGWQHPVDIRLQDIRVVTHEGKIFASFPQISVSLDLWQLPLGRVLPTSITLNQPAISLFQQEDRSIGFGFGALGAGNEDSLSTPEASVPLQTFTALLFSSDSDSGFRKLDRLRIRDATVSIGNVKRRSFFELRDADILARRDWYGGVKLIAGGEMVYKNRQAPIGIEISASGDGAAMDGTLMFENIVPSALASLFMDEGSDASGVELPLKGKITFRTDADGELKSAAFDLTGGKGRLKLAPLELPLEMDALRAVGRLGAQARDIRIDTLSASMGKTRLLASGRARRLDGDDLSLEGRAVIDAVAASDIRKFWPPSLSPMSREWVITNITEGQVTQAAARVNIRPGDLKKPVLPKESVEAFIRLSEGTIRYLPEHPPVKKVDSVVRVDGVSLQADIERAQFLQSTTLSKGRLEIADLNADNPYITLRFHGQTIARDAVDILKLPRLEHAARLNLDPASVKGDGVADVSLGFHFFAPVGPDGKPQDDITYQVAADLKQFTVPAFLKRFDIEGGTGEMTIDNKQLRFSGTGNVNGAAVSKADVLYRFEPEEGVDTVMDVTARAPVSSLPKFGYPALGRSTGAIGVEAKITLGPQVETYDATLRLADATIDVPSLGWTKPAQVPADFSIQAERKSDSLHIHAFSLSGPEMKAAGTAALSKDLTRIERLETGALRLGGIDLDRLEYRDSGSEMFLSTAGRSVDLSGWLEGDEDQPKTFSFKRFPGVRLNAEIARLRLSRQAPIERFKADLVCTPVRCERANITGVVGEGKTFDFRILRNPKGQRQLSLQAADAGGFFKALGAYPNLEGGALTLTGNYAEKRLKGRLLITDFTVKKAPVLARILSLASITGMADLLSGNGIVFSKLAAPFSLEDDVVMFESAKAYGPSIGLTAEGTMTFPQQTLNLQGTVVPAYVINNLLGKVPIVGTLLTGGDGGGVFAFHYTVKGTERDPDVSVNPLSILTPGFLRGVFEDPDIASKP